MKTWIFICMSIAMLLWFLSTLRRKPSQKKGCIDAIIPAYNEARVWRSHWIIYCVTLIFAG